MLSFRSIKKNFVIAAALMSSAAASAQLASQEVKKTSSAVSANAQQTAGAIDYAFGDQVATAMGLPGSAGKDWGFKETRRALEDFLKKHPTALKGKTVLVAVTNPGMMDAILRANGTGEDFIKAVGPAGRVILIGASERRLDGQGFRANGYTKKFVEDHKNVAVYGGPSLPRAKQGEVLDPSRDYIFPKTAEEFQALRRQAADAVAANPAAPKKIAPSLNK